jgi:hypothetical protein
MTKNVEHKIFQLHPQSSATYDEPIFMNFTFDHVDTRCGHLTYSISPKQVKKYGQYRQKFLYAKSSLPCILHTESTKDQHNVVGQVQQLTVIRQTHQHFIHY